MDGYAIKEHSLSFGSLRTLSMAVSHCDTILLLDCAM